MKQIKTSLGPFKEYVNKKTIAETAFQRAIWACGKSNIGNRIITWLDIELPVDERKSARGHCIDLIGVDETSKSYVVCELKFRRNSDHGSPVKAIKQLQDYRNAIAKNKTTLKSTVHHANCAATFDWRDVDSPKTIWVIAANEKYWHDHRKITPPADIECYSLPVDSDTFEKDSQQSPGKYYKPQLQPWQNKWRNINTL